MTLFELQKLLKKRVEDIAEQSGIHDLQVLSEICLRLNMREMLTNICRTA